MAKAKTNRVRIKVGKEGTYGVKPAAATFRATNFLSASLKAPPLTTSSATIRSDRQRADSMVVGKQVSGTTAHELQGSVAFKELLEAAMLNTVANALPEGTVASVAAGTGIYTVGAGQGTPFVAGMLTCASGMLADANNSANPTTGVVTAFKVTASTANTVTTNNASSVLDAAAQTGARLKVCGQEVATGDLALTLVGGQAVLTLTAGTWLTTYLKEGAWFYLGSFGAAFGLSGANADAHEGWYRIAKGGIAAKVLTCDVKPAGYTATSVTSATNAVRVYFGDLLVNGVTMGSCSVERSFMDIGVHEVFVGVVPNSVDLEVPARDKLKVSFGLMGMDASMSGAEYAATPIPAPLNTPYTTAGTSLGAIFEAGTVAAVGINALKVNVTNNLRELPQLFTASGSAGLNDGECTVTGTLSPYFEDQSLLTKLANSTATAIAVAGRDPQGSAQVWDLPRVKFNDGAPEVGGGNQEVSLDMPFDAFMHPQLGYTIGITTLELVGY